MMEFGLRLGLAQDLQYDQRINDLRYQNQLKKQATLEAQAKAKMFSDDFDYQNAMNEHDNPLVKEFAKGKIKEIGAFINANPDWEMSVEKRAMYKQMVRELKDNKDLNRGIQSDQNIKLYNAYMADPKNNEMIETPEFKQKMIEYNNYLKFGNQYGEEAAQRDGKKAFMFSAPEEAVDTHKILVDLAKATEYDSRDRYGYDGYRQSISKDRKLQAVEHAIASGQWGKYLKKDYDKYIAQLNENERTNAKSINEFTLERMEPYFNSEKIEIGHQAPIIRPPSNRGGGGQSGAMTRDMWMQMHKEALNKKDATLEFGPDAMQATFGNKYGEMNLNGVVTPLGDPINLGLTKAQSTGIVTVGRTPAGLPVANHKVMVRMPVEQFYALGGNYQKVIDEGGITQGITPLRNSDKNWDIHEEYQKDFKKYTDEKDRNFVEFAVQHKYDPFNVHYADSYSNAHNVSAHKEDPYAMYGDGQSMSYEALLQQGYSKQEIEEAIAAGYNIR